MTDNTDELCEELHNVHMWWKSGRLKKPSIHCRASNKVCVGGNNASAAGRRDHSESPVNFTADPEFQEFRNVCVMYYIGSCSVVVLIGAEVNRASVMTSIDEDKL